MQEFIYCIVPLVFKISFTAELPLAMNILHSLLEDFLWHYYYSKAYSGLFKFLEHARQFRNSAVKLSPSVIFKKSLAKLKGPGFKLDSSEVPFIFYGFHFSPCLTLNTLNPSLCRSHHWFKRCLNAISLPTLYQTVSFSLSKNSYSTSFPFLLSLALTSSN